MKDIGHTNSEVVTDIGNVRRLKGHGALDGAELWSSMRKWTQMSCKTGMTFHFEP